MSKKEIAVSRWLIILTDLCIVAGSFFLGYLLRDHIHGIYRIYNLSAYIGLLPILLVIWGSLLVYYFEGYDVVKMEQIPEMLFMVFKMTLIGFMIFGSFTYVFKITYISRTLMVFIFLLASVFISLEKIALVFLFQYVRKKGYNYRNVLIIGTGKRAQHFIDLIDSHYEWGMKTIGLVDQECEKVGQLIGGYKVLGTFKDVPEIIHNNVVDEVLFVVPRSWVGQIEDIMLLCEKEGIKIEVAVDYFDLKLSTAKPAEMAGLPLLTFKSTTDKLWHLMIKRVFDLFSSGAALVVLSPLLFVVSVLIKLTSSGPIFYRQERCGLHGRKFTLYKFRTMVMDAETQLDDLLKHNEMTGPVFKMENDPRITNLGRFLRKFSIDELPQFWNVFTGDMSIVGPRPPIPSEVNQYDGWHRRRLSMKPGVTCLWQVNGRNRITDFNEWVKLDLEYIDNWSLWLECKIILKTIPTVLFGVGAK